MFYWAQFGTSTITGLAPTFIQFRTTAGGTLAPPSISDPGSVGAYVFQYNALTQIFFQLDGATTGLAFSDRYVTGVLDPFDNLGFTLQALGNTNVALGTTNVAIGTTLIGYGVSNIALGTSNLAQGLTALGYGVSGFALGLSIFAQGQTAAALTGNTASSFGTELVDPTTVFGFLKRAQETREGNETYTKASGALDIYSRGSSQILAEKVISDSTVETTKT